MIHICAIQLLREDSRIIGPIFNKLGIHQTAFNVELLLSTIIEQGIDVSQPLTLIINKSCRISY